MVDFSLYCKCGVHWEGKLSGSAYQSIISDWRKEHTGIGHGSCNAREALKTTKRESDLVIRHSEAAACQS